MNAFSIFYICILFSIFIPSATAQILEIVGEYQKDPISYNEVMTEVRKIELNLVKMQKLESRVKNLENEISLLKSDKTEAKGK